MANVTLKDNVVRQYEDGTTAADIAKSLGMGLYKAACSVKIDGAVCDLRTPVTKDCQLEVLTFEDESTDMQNFSETLRMFQWGYSQFAWRDILKTTDLLARVPIIHGSGADFVNARPEAALTLLLDNSVPTESFIRDITLFNDEDDPLVAPISAGDVLGEVTITRDGIEYAKMDLVANTDVNLSGVEYMRGQVSDMLASNIARNVMIVLGLLLLIYLALVVRYNIVRANRLRRIKNAKNDIIRERHQNFRD